MALVELDQNTKEWLEQRKRFIGGSDVPTIMCVSPWRTPLQLWEEKLTICTPDHASKAYIYEKGHRFEIIARHQYELKIGFDIPAQVIQHDTIPWARVSLDCFNLKHQFVGEIKFMGEADWILLKETGKVPEHYWPQVQYQLMCTGFKCLHFIGINKQKQIAATLVYPDIEYMKKMVRWCSHFWGMVQAKTPPRHIPGDYKQLRIKKTKQAAHELFWIDQEIHKLLERRKDLQKVIMEKAKSTRMTFDDKVLLRICDFEDVDLERITEMRKLDHSHLARSIRDDLSLVVLDKTEQGGIYGTSQRNKKSITKKLRELKGSRDQARGSKTKRGSQGNSKGIGQERQVKTGWRDQWS